MNNRKKVVVIQSFSDVALAMLEARSDIEVEVVTDLNPENIAARIADANAITLRDAPMPIAALEGARRLKLISRHGVGYDNLPIAYCTERGIPVSIIGDLNAVSVAEHTLYLMLAVAKNGGQAERGVRAGDFAIRGRLFGVELSGKTLLLVGYGRIGQEFALRARALGMNVAVFDPFVDRGRHADVRFFDSLDEALGEADVVSLHTPLNDKTRNLIDAAALSRMKPRAILLNAARGGIIDEAALIAALDAGHLHGVGLDVFAREPLSADSPLLRQPAITLSPHNAALTAECLVAMGRATVRNVLDFFDGKLDPALVVNRAALPDLEKA